MSRFIALSFALSVCILSNISFAQNSSTKNPLHSPVAQPSSVKTGTFLGETGPLRDFPVIADLEKFAAQRKFKKAKYKETHKELNPGLKTRLYPNKQNALPKGSDPLWQLKERNIQATPIVDRNFAGQTASYGPTDCNGAVGPNHFMQTINMSYTIYSKTGTKLAGPTDMNLLFSGVTGSECNDGDPIIIYDDQANRWLAAEFSLCNTNDLMLVAVSSTNDPTGTWYKYSFDVDDTPDYMKFGVWRDGYYMGTNNSGGKDVYVFDRSVMLTGGANPTMIGFVNPNRPNSGFHCIMPLDNDGSPAASNAPGLFITINDDAWGSSDALWIYELTANWTTPSNSTFSRVQALSVPAFDSDFGTSWDNITQPGTTQKLDAIPQVLMFRAQYLNFGSYQTMVVCHTVDVDNTDHAGIRWYELRKTTGNWTIRQNGTYAPDVHSRWLGSISMNQKHEIGLGYSISSSTIYPGIRFTGQSSSANSSANGLFDIDETIIQNGTVSQGGFNNRWGDYAEMSYDPADTSTFWFTTEYNTSSSAKATRIAAFHFPPENVPPVPDFSASKTLINIGDSINFTDLSQGTVDYRLWSFTGGVPNSSTTQNPTGVKYYIAGDFTVSLFDSNSFGSAIKTKVAYIKVLDPAVPTCDTVQHFAGTPILYYADKALPNDSGYISGTNSIKDKAKAEYFDEYGLYNEIDGTDIYFGFAKGTGNVTVNVWRDNNGTPGSIVGTKSIPINTIINDISLGNPTHIDFSPNVIIPGPFYIGIIIPENPGDAVAIFTNTVGDSPLEKAWEQWNDGTWSKYSSAWGKTISNKIFVQMCTNPTLAPVADFKSDKTEFMAGGNVNFADLSYGGIVSSWNWIFPGGSPSSSTSQNPSGVIYNTPGHYDVTLIVSNTNGSDTLFKPGYIYVMDPSASNCDTLINTVGALGNYMVAPPQTGYISGNNSYADKAKAEYFANYSPYTKIDGAYFGFAVAKDAGTASDITINVYRNNGTGNSPGTVISTKTVAISSIMPKTLNYIQFTAPVIITGPFYIGVVLPTVTGDTISLYSGASNSSTTNTAWEMWSDNTWYAYSDGSSWGSNYNLAIYPQVCTDGKPIANFNSDMDSSCIGATIQFNSQSTGWPTSYSWIFTGGIPPSFTEQNPTVTYNSPGQYTVSLTVTNGSGMDSIIKSNYITIVNPPSISINHLNEYPLNACNGSAAVNPTGTGPFSYLWSNNSTGTTSFNGTTGTVTNGTTTNFTSVVSGQGALDGIMYSLEKVCVDLSTGATGRVQDWDVYLIAPDATQITLSSDNGTGTPGSLNVCFTPNATNSITTFTSANATGDYKPETALSTLNNGQSANGKWTLKIIDDAAGGGASTLTGWSLFFTYSFPVTTSDISNLCSGTYTVTLTDAVGCKTVDSVIIESFLPLIASISSQNNVSCFGGNDGSATISVSGGIPSYSYLWSDGSTSGNISNLTTGAYTVTVTDSKGLTTSVGISLSQPTIMSVNSTIIDVSCYGYDTGTISLAVSGGTPVYSYSWNTNPVITSSVATDLLAGTYTVTVIDSKGCTISNTSIVNDGTPIIVNFSNTDASCNQSDGSSTVSVSGGAGNYSYSWNTTPAQLSAVATGLSAGSYYVVITDSLNCAVGYTTNIIDIGSPTVILNGTDPVCIYNSSGVISTTVSGGTAPYIYSWSNSDTSSSVQNLNSGTYTVTVTDINTCKAVVNLTLTSLSNISLTFTSFNPTCNGSNNGNVTVLPIGGVADYTYNWSDGQTTAVDAGLGGGTYSVTVTDSKGCTAAGSSSISEPFTLSTTMGSINSKCGMNNGTAFVTVSGGSFPYIYSWSSGSLSDSIINIPSGKYFVQVTDKNGCVKNDSVFVNSDFLLIDFTASPVIIDKGDTVFFINGSEPGLNFNWNFGDGSYSQLTSPYYIYPFAGVYTVTLKATNSGGCVDSIIKLDYITVQQPVSIYSINTDGKIFVFPNPADNKLYIKSTFNLSRNQINLFNILGVNVENRIEIHSTNSDLLDIDIKYLPTGVYILRIISNDNRNVSVLFNKK